MIQYPKEIYEFGVKWLEKFNNNSITAEEIYNDFLEEAKDLGFKTSTSPVLLKLYQEEDQVIEDSVKNFRHLNVIGNGLFTKVNSLKEDNAPVCDILACKLWFVKLLEKLVNLSAKNNILFEGKLKEAYLHSTVSCFLPHNDGELINQNFILMDNHHIISESTYFGASIVERKEKVIAPDKYELLVKRLVGQFSQPYYQKIVTDCGKWQLKLINDEGKVFEYSGPVGVNIDPDLTDLSEIIREITNCNNLILFDNNLKEESSFKPFLV